MKFEHMHTAKTTNTYTVTMCVRVSTETDLIPNSLLSFSSLSGNVFWAHFTEPRVKKWQRRMAETLKKSLRWLHHGNQHERNLRVSKPIIAVPSWSSSSGISKKNTTRDVGVGTKKRHSTWWSKVNGRKFLRTAFWHSKVPL